MRHVALMGGGDWADASVDHLLVQDDVDLVAEKEAWRKWYFGTYVKSLRLAEYQDFTQWLVGRGKAILDATIERVHGDEL